MAQERLTPGQSNSNSAPWIWLPPSPSRTPYTDLIPLFFSLPEATYNIRCLHELKYISGDLGFHFEMPNNPLALKGSYYLLIHINLNIEEKYCAGKSLLAPPRPFFSLLPSLGSDLWSQNHWTLMTHGSNMGSGWIEPIWGHQKIRILKKCNRGSTGSTPSGPQVCNECTSTMKATAPVGWPFKGVYRFW